MRPLRNKEDEAHQLDLVRAACAGDEAAFGELFRLLYARVLRTVWGMMGNETEAHDVVQDAWIKAWKERERFNFKSAFSTWITRIAIHTALDALRRRKRRRSRFLGLFSAGDDKAMVDPADAKRHRPDVRTSDRELGRRIEEAIAELPEDQRTVLVLREYERYSYEEIAEVVGCKPGTVMSRLHLARKKLQSRLGKELS